MPTKTLDIPEKLYGRSDIDIVNVPTDETKADGSRVTHKHVRTKAMQKDDGKPGPFVLECKLCIQKLVEMDPNIVTRSLDPNVQFSTHWAPNPRSVPKSEAELQEEEASQAAYLRGNVTDYEEFLEFKKARRGGKRAINVGQ